MLAFPAFPDVVMGNCLAVESDDEALLGFLSSASSS